MENHQKRVIREQEELTNKINKLKDFICSFSFHAISAIDRELLIKQLKAMRSYNRILITRIERFC